MLLDWVGLKLVMIYQFEELGLPSRAARSIPLRGSHPRVSHLQRNAAYLRRSRGAAVPNVEIHEGSICRT